MSGQREIEMFLLEIKVGDDPPTVDLCDTVKECVNMAIQQIDDGSRKNFAEIERSLLTRRAWSGSGISISIKKR